MQKEKHENEEYINPEHAKERNTGLNFLNWARVDTTPYLWTAERRSWKKHFGEFPYEAMRCVQQLTKYGENGMAEYTAVQGKCALRAAKLFLSRGGILYPDM